jgi:AcrR family transcriptional regulator
VNAFKRRRALAPDARRVDNGAAMTVPRRPPARPATRSARRSAERPADRSDDRPADRPGDRGAARVDATPRRVQERSLETRARLVDCAIECLSELGYAGATTPLIAARAGVTRGALQHHFASRTDLDVAVIDRVATELNFRLDVEALRARPLEARVEALIDTYWKAFSSPLFRAALNIWLAVLRDPPVGERLRDHLSSRHDRIRATWGALFADTGRTTAELETLRHVVMGAARGYAVERFFLPKGTGRAERLLLRRMMLGALVDDGTGCRAD